MGRTDKKREIEELYPDAFRALGNITWLQRRYNTPEEEIVKALGKTQNTWINRKQEPWKLTVEELTNIGALWNVTPSQLMVEPRLIVEPMEII